MNSNIFCLGSPSYKKVPKQGRKKKNVKKDVKSVNLRIRINPFFYFRNLNDNQIERLSSKTFAGLLSLEKL